MKCVIPGANVKIFGKSIHSLSRIGDELYIEPLEHGLALRTVNSSRSAYACFVFVPAFFLHYDDGSKVSPPKTTDTEGDDDDEVLKCKISMKSCLTIFKSLATLEKTVDKCKIHLDMADARLIFQMHCRHGIVKTYNLAFIECETLQAVFSKDLTPNVLTANTKLLSEAVMNFQNNQEEVSLIVSPEKVCLKNYVEDEPDQTKVVHTQMQLMPEEFDRFQAGVDTEVTFCLKELRAILGFSEAAGIAVSIHFEGPGKPIIFYMDSDSSFEAHFVLATLADKSSQVSVSQQSVQPPRGTQAKKNTSASTSRASANYSVKASSKTTASAGFSRTIGSFRAGTSANTNMSASRPFPAKRRTSFEDEPATKRQETATSRDKSTDTVPSDKSSTSGDSSRSRISRNAQLQAALEDLMNDSDIEMPEDTTLNQTSVNGAKPPQTSGSSESQGSLRIPVQNMEGQTSVTEASGFFNPDEDEDDEVPGTPPRKAEFKSLFFGLSQASSMPSQANRNPNLMVLAEDTDEDE